MPIAPKCSAPSLPLLAAGGRLGPPPNPPFALHQAAGPEVAGWPQKGGDKAPERPGVYLGPTRTCRLAGVGRGYPQGLSYTRPLGQLYGEGGGRKQAKWVNFLYR
jgi:hypothetical protein